MLDMPSVCGLLLPRTQFDVHQKSFWGLLGLIALGLMAQGIFIRCFWCAYRHGEHCGSQQSKPRCGIWHDRRTPQQRTKQAVCKAHTPVSPTRDDTATESQLCAATAALCAG